MALVKSSSKLVGACPRALQTLFHSSSISLGHGSHASDNDPEVLEKEKHKTLKGEHVSTLKKTPGWNERLASDSEAAVKADKEEHDDVEHEDHILELQKHTVETVEKVEKSQVKTS